MQVRHEFFINKDTNENGMLYKVLRNEKKGKMWKAGFASSLSPVEENQGGYVTIFQNMLHHQVKLNAVQSRIDQSPPQLTIKALDQLNSRHPKPKRPESAMVEKTFQTVQKLSAEGREPFF